MRRPSKGFVLFWTGIWGIIKSKCILMMKKLPHYGHQRESVFDKLCKHQDEPTKIYIRSQLRQILGIQSPPLKGSVQKLRRLSSSHVEKHIGTQTITRLPRVLKFVWEMSNLL